MSSQFFISDERKGIHLKQYSEQHPEGNITLSYHFLWLWLTYAKKKQRKIANVQFVESTLHRIFQPEK